MAFSISDITSIFSLNRNSINWDVSNWANDTAALMGDEWVVMVSDETILDKWYTYHDAIESDDLWLTSEGETFIRSFYTRVCDIYDAYDAALEFEMWVAASQEQAVTDFPFDMTFVA